MEDIPIEIKKGELYRLYKQGRIVILPKKKVMQYSYKQTLKKAVRNAVIILATLFVNGFFVTYPEYTKLVIGGTTIGGVLFFVLDWLKHRMNLRLIP